MQRAALVQGSTDADVLRVETTETAGMNPTETITRDDGIKISWHDGIELVPGKLNKVCQREGLY
jgi:NADH dehydrogenase [ubiquinone] 1 alpha subcomplex assembly factor 7